MKNTILAIASVAALSAAALPAAAQHRHSSLAMGVDGPTYVADLNAQQNRLAYRINNAERRGRLSYSEAERLREEVRETNRLEARYRRTNRHVSREEYVVIKGRLNRIEARMHLAMRDGDRYDRYDNRRYGAGYGRW